MGHNAASADLSELEEALREIAFMSNGKNVRSHMLPRNEIHYSCLLDYY